MKSDHWQAITYRGPRNPQLLVAWRRSRRIAALAHHPDRGGDGEHLQRELDRIDLRFMRAEMVGNRPDDELVYAEWMAAPAPMWQPAARVLRRASRRMRTALHSTRARMPTVLPGSRRYIDL